MSREAISSQKKVKNSPQNIVKAAKTPDLGTYPGFSPGSICRFCRKVVQMCSFVCLSTLRDRFGCPISARLIPKKTALCRRPNHRGKLRQLREKAYVTWRGQLIQGQARPVHHWERPRLWFGGETQTYNRYITKWLEVDLHEKDGRRRNGQPPQTQRRTNRGNKRQQK